MIDGDVDEPCKGDTPAKPRAQALGIIVNIFIEPRRGGTTLDKGKCSRYSAAPAELLFFVSMFTQGSISGFALITPWALQEYRAYGTRN